MKRDIFSNAFSYFSASKRFIKTMGNTSADRTDSVTLLIFTFVLIEITGNYIQTWSSWGFIVHQ